MLFPDLNADFWDIDPKTLKYGTKFKIVKWIVKNR